MALKQYDSEEKKAQCLATKLSGVAFDVYMRMSAEEKKVYETVKKELRTEFKKGSCNRKTALNELSSCTYRDGSLYTCVRNYGTCEAGLSDV